ncbi:hypothetical protein H8356DRAFT_1053287 [Neocallimastix lanati (nom. inval.)]|jgi:WAS family protein 2|uniref:WH2 domain-containing protein n=1 Tax=Neocallimastix californiae TaxID=1754190 RepID=A0A1Y2ELY8_9FUNG|nr:hypothetical protein H8356DRAFT_1053287 [Neocallimastix sp. JGI-2020a]ORY72552.1 hypothetical protein LY90DRAFT_667139 [Neocallimastix californiae]|eukprot:ORY72552.1 hypothetical protein LY90DRAFT_667139 [Neocallimastix californiae]
MPLTRRKIEVPLPVTEKKELTLESLISPQLNQEPSITREQSFKKTNIIQLTQLLGQLSNISQYAHELFTDLIKQTNETSERINNIKARINAINSNIGQVEKKMGMMTVTNTPNPELLEFKQQDNVPEANLFTKQSQPFAISEAYQKCENLPDFTEIDNLRTDGNKCSKLYSNPNFFLEEYTDKMNKDIEIKKKRKEERKKDKVKLRKEKKINEISKKQYNKDGEVITQKLDQERKRESRLSRMSQSSTHESETAHQSSNTTSSVPHPPSVFMPPSVPTMSNMNSTAVPPPPALNQGAPPPPQFMSMPQVPQVPAATNAPPPPPPPAVNAPPPPPPPPMATNAPPPPPPPSGGAPLPPSNTNSLLSAIQQRPQLKPATSNNLAPTDSRDDLLSNIKMGGFKLRKVEINENRKQKDDLEGRNDVAALLIRRVALEDSDSSESEESDSDSDDDWD